MTLLALVAIIFFGFATYNLTCAFVDIPTKKTSRMMMLARKQQGVKAEKLLDVYITKIAGLIAPYLKLDKLKRNKLQRALDIAGLELTPEIYTARAWVTAGAVGLCSIAAIPFLRMLRQIGVTVTPCDLCKLHDVKAALSDVGVVIVDIGTLLFHLGAVRFRNNDVAVVGQIKQGVVIGLSGIGVDFINGDVQDTLMAVLLPLLLGLEQIIERGQAHVFDVACQVSTPPP